MKKVFIKVLMIIIFLMLIVYSLRNICLNIFGSTTTGYITNTTQKLYNSEESDGKIYRNTSSYYFMLDGKKYEGYASYKTAMPIVRVEDQEIRKVTVQYLKIFPYANALKEYNENSAVSYVMVFGLIAISVFGIFKVIKTESKKTNKNVISNMNEWLCECVTKNESSKIKPKIKSTINVGWSDKINDPKFAKFKRNRHGYALIFGIVLAVIAFVGFFIYGKQSGNEEEMFTVGCVISGMFLSISICTNIKSKSAKTWEGTVINKTHEQKRKKVYSGNTYYFQEYEEFAVIAKNNNTGKIKRISIEENSTFQYDYWNIGDKFKFHGNGINNYEKYDKSKDTISFCLACGYLNDIENDECEKCGCPILK